jgi:hypothetical protein
MSVLCREPEKAAVPVPPIEIQDVPTFSGPTALPDSHWRDRDDLIETDYTPSDKKPSIELHQIGVCPRFTFKCISSHSHYRSTRSFPDTLFFLGFFTLSGNVLSRHLFVETRLMVKMRRLYLSRRPPSLVTNQLTFAT